LVPTNPPISPGICFGPFELDVAAGELRKAGILIKLQPQPFRVLLLLAERGGTVVTREEIQQHLWSESTFVDFEHGINFSTESLSILPARRGKDRSFCAWIRKAEPQFYGSRAGASRRGTGRSATTIPALFALPSPDGRQLAIYSWSFNANMWMLENF
jgi:hypothetical protein